MQITTDPTLAERALAGAKRSFDGFLLPVAGSAVKGYFATAMAMTGFTLVLVVVAALIAAPAPWWAASASGSLALAAGTLGGLIIAPKRAVSGAIVEGLRRAGIGGSLARLVFDRLLALKDEDSHGERGVAVAQRAERLPFASAEQRLRGVVDRFVREPSAERGLRAWFERKIRQALLEQIERITLARFREENQKHGGVDLTLVRDDLASTIDGMLVDRFAGAASATTYLVLAAVVVASVAPAFLARLLLG